MDLGARLFKTPLGLIATSASTLILLALFGVQAFILVPTAAADYTPPPNTPGYVTVGSGGALVQSQSTALDPYDAVGAWNTWTSKSKLSVGSAGCGTTTSCIIYVNEGSALAWTYCTAPMIYETGVWARTYQITSSGNNLGDPYCNGLAPNYPIYVVDYNTSLGLGSIARLHVQRHKIGHGIGLADAPTVYCWQDYGYWKPLMNNGTESGYCSAFPNNYTASYNEALYAVLRSGWS